MDAVGRALPGAIAEQEVLKRNLVILAQAGIHSYEVIDLTERVNVRKSYYYSV